MHSTQLDAPLIVGELIPLDFLDDTLVLGTSGGWLGFSLDLGSGAKLILVYTVPDLQ